MSTKQTSMLSFLEMVQHIEEYYVVDEEPTATKKKKASFNCQYNE